VKQPLRGKLSHVGTSSVGVDRASGRWRAAEALLSVEGTPGL
jgi:hypothetical protein